MMGSELGPMLINVAVALYYFTLLLAQMTLLIYLLQHIPGRRDPEIGCSSIGPNVKFICGT